MTGYIRFQSKYKVLHVRQVAWSFCFVISLIIKINKMKKVIIQIHILQQGDRNVPFIHMYIATSNCKLKLEPGQMSPIFNLMR